MIYTTNAYIDAWAKNQKQAETMRRTVMTVIGVTKTEMDEAIDRADLLCLDALLYCVSRNIDLSDGKAVRYAMSTAITCSTVHASALCEISLLSGEALTGAGLLDLIQANLENLGKRKEKLPWED